MTRAGGPWPAPSRNASPSRATRPRCNGTRVLASSNGLARKCLPLRGRGVERADIRIHAIDPLSRDFWPFPDHGVDTADADAPPLPGNEPKAWSESADIEADAIKERIKALGSPAISRLAILPLRRDGADARFGIDLSEDFARIKGREQPGAYLVGLRAPGESARHWLRVVVTDLTLSAIEEPGRVRFAVTSLATAQPVAGAQLRVEGVRDDKFVTLAQGTTDASGFFTWSLAKRAEAELRRVVVTKGLDTLVVDPGSAPSEYSKENWSKPDADWLAWTTEPRASAHRGAAHAVPSLHGAADLSPRGARAYQGLCAGVSRRRVEPAEARRDAGRQRSRQSGMAHSGQARREPAASITNSTRRRRRPGTMRSNTNPPAMKPKAKEPDQGRRRDAKDDQQAENGDEQPAPAAAPEDLSCGNFPFKKEAYRLPTFEVVLNAPQMVPLDGEFNVDLLARYFAGGLAADRPVKWRAAQFPYVFTPPGREGFLFSTDARFSGDAKFKSTAVLERDQRTDAGGAARMSFDTTIEPTAQPRRYSIEATVTGDDGIEVRNVQNVIAVPPFVLGVKTPRYVARPGAITPELIAINGKGEAVEGLEMTLRFIKRNWISTLQASDFAQGAAKYVTQAQDETLLERKVDEREGSAKDRAGGEGRRRLCRAARSLRPHRPAPAGQRRLFRRRRHARHLPAPAIFHRDRHARQGEIRAGRDRDAAGSIAVPERARARHRRTAGRRLRLSIHRHRQRLWPLCADAQKRADAEARRAFSDHARTPQGQRANRRLQHRPGQADHDRRDEMDRGHAGQEHRHGETGGAGQGAAGPGGGGFAAAQPTTPASRSLERPHSGWSIRPCCRWRRSSRSIRSPISLSRATPKWRRATPATWRSESFRWRRFPAATARRWRNGARRTTSPCGKISRPCRSICRA